MFNEFLAKNINAVYGGGDYADVVARQYKGHNIIPAMVHHGFGQVEPNHLSAQRTSQVYAQLPAAKDIEVLQQGQFVKYNYAKGQVDFEGRGEWMLVYNEIKLYRDFQDDCEFAMIKDNYQARIYSPFGGAKYTDGVTVGINGVENGADFAKTDIFLGKQSRYYNGVDNEGNTHYTFNFTKATTYDANTRYFTLDDTTGKYSVAEVADADAFAAGDFYVADPNTTYKYDDVTAAPDMYEMHYNEDPFHIYGLGKELRMPDGTAMVPRVLKTNVGDIFTTNTVDAKIETITVGGLLTPRATDGILIPTKNENGMLWQISKIYTMPDHQPGVKIMRVQ